MIVLTLSLQNLPLQPVQTNFNLLAATEFTHTTSASNASLSMPPVQTRFSLSMVCAVDYAVSIYFQIFPINDELS
jgi:hypothetical protein